MAMFPSAKQLNPLVFTKKAYHIQVMDSDADGVPSEFFDYFKVSAWLFFSPFTFKSPETIIVLSIAVM